MSVLVRPATAGDHAAVLALVPRLHAFGAVPLRDAADLDRAEREALRAALATPRPDAAVLVAGLPDLPVAGVAYLHEAVDYFTGETHGHLAILAVAEPAEGRGAGRALLAAAEAWAAGRGHRFLTLYVFAANERARTVYERAGFAPDTLKYFKALAPSVDDRPGDAPGNPRVAAP